jgi:hypothetical protein
MPRSAATVFGLVLVAFSIGFNTARYPVVWEMVKPARASESAQAAIASQAEQPEPPPPPQPVPSLPAKPIDVKPASDSASKVVADTAAPADAAPARPVEAATGQSETRKALVPVTPISSERGLAGESVVGVGIRRLPPVPPSDPLAVSHDAAVLANGSIPFYPTTGIE